MPSERLQTPVYASGIKKHIPDKVEDVLGKTLRNYTAEAGEWVDFGANHQPMSAAGMIQ